MQHIENLYKDQTILKLFKECYVSEKIEGATVSLKWEYLTKKFTIEPGPASEEVVRHCIPENIEELFAKEFPDQDVVILGELYGDKHYLPKKSAKYKIEIGFVAFKAILNGYWVSMDDSAKIADILSIPFVDYGIYPTDIEVLNTLRDKKSVLGMKWAGIEVPREGIVIEPLIPMRIFDNYVIAKHKAKEERETATVREVSSDKLQVLADAQAIADEWVTENRLEHVMSKITLPREKQYFPVFAKAMVADIYREGTGEIVQSKEATSAIMKKTAELLRKFNDTRGN